MSCRVEAGTEPLRRGLVHGAAGVEEEAAETEPGAVKPAGRARRRPGRGEGEKQEEGQETNRHGGGSAVVGFLVTCWWRQLLYARFYQYYRFLGAVKCGS